MAALRLGEYNGRQGTDSVKPEKCDVIAEKLKDWDFLKNLPEQVLDFHLQTVGKKDGLEYIFVRYANNDRCSLELAYTEETGDFVVVKNVGFFRFRDDRFYNRDCEKFAVKVLPALEKIILEISRGHNGGYPSVAEGLGFETWKISKQLPKEINGYKLYITPETPLRFLNGSYVIVCYEEIEKQNQLAIFYNEYRNEIFGEFKRAGIFEFTRDFDVTFSEEKHGTKKELFLQEAQAKILENMESAILKLD